MKKLLGFVAALVISTAAFAQKGPKIGFSSDTVDYGTISKEQDNGIRVFEFTNTGDAPLVISDVKSTSGITITSRPREAIMPGKTGRIEVKYGMGVGPIRRTITIESNAVNYPNGVVPLKIKGEVIDKNAATNDKKKAVDN